MAEELKACRYRVEKTGYGFWPYCVRAGDGTRELFKGHQKQCMVVAAELETAFEDGKFVADRAQVSQGGEAVGVAAAEIYWTNENPEWQLDMLCEIPCAPLERIKLYTHPADQVADGVAVSRELRSVLAMILNALDRDAAEGKAARGEMASELRALLASAEGVKN